MFADISLGIYYAYEGAVFASVSTFCFLIVTQVIVQVRTSPYILR